jgi:hypothetical protein
MIEFSAIGHCGNISVALTFEILSPQQGLAALSEASDQQRV